MDPETFRVWLQVLASAPRAVLWLLRLPSTAEANLRREAASAGLEAARLVFSDRLDWETHLVGPACQPISFPRAPPPRRPIRFNSNGISVWGFR